MAISMIIANVPESVYISDMGNIMPVLLQCISLDDSEIRRSAIETIDSAGSGSKDVIALHLSSLVPALISATVLNDVNTPVRRLIQVQDRQLTYI